MRNILRTTPVAAALLIALSSGTALAAEPSPSAAPKRAEVTKKAPKAAESDKPAAKPANEQSSSVEELRAMKERLELEAALEKQRRERELGELEAKKQAIVKQLELDAAQRKLELSKLDAETARVTAELEAMQKKLALEDAKRKLEKSAIDGDREIVEARRASKKRVAADVEYKAQPFVDGVLHVSDRRVPLNGPVTMEMADRITERIHFFNNQNPEHPIFIVIDYSPGGSVMAGSRILEAMEKSEAPVHVLVKSFAASMAAVITTRAEHSYAYPNAMILHHQLSSGNGGNLTRQAQNLAQASQWSKRMLGPVHGKMGITHDQFVKKMYEHDADGDWKEFADEAKKLGWVRHVVGDVREASIVDIDKGLRGDAPQRAEEKRDPAGKAYVELPRLLPGDHWFMHDPDDYYR